jgi:hypothetical protein
VCRAAAGECDIDEKCTGAAADCPTDALQPSTFVCRAAAGACDSVAEKCSGVGADCPPDQNGCASNQYCNGASCLAKKANGASCTQSQQCTSNYCVDGVCCNTSCSGGCRACNLPSSPGVCTNHGAGTDPENACPNYKCDGKGACYTTCSGLCSTQCDNYCSGSACAGVKKALGQVCTQSCECGSGNCVDGVCCNSSCTGACKACNIANSVGTCTNRAKGTDPENGCGNYYCNDSGACFTKCSGGTTLAGCGTGICKSKAFCSPSGGCATDLKSGSACIVGCVCDSGVCLYPGLPVCW